MLKAAVCMYRRVTVYVFGGAMSLTLITAACTHTHSEALNIIVQRIYEPNANRKKSGKVLA